MKIQEIRFAKKIKFLKMITTILFLIILGWYECVFAVQTVIINRNWLGHDERNEIFPGEDLHSKTYVCALKTSSFHTYLDQQAIVFCGIRKMLQTRGEGQDIKPIVCNENEPLILKLTALSDKSKTPTPGRRDTLWAFQVTITYDNINDSTTQYCNSPFASRNPVLEEALTTPPRAPFPDIFTATSVVGSGSTILPSAPSIIEQNQLAQLPQRVEQDVQVRREDSARKAEQDAQAREDAARKAEQDAQAREEAARQPIVPGMLQHSNGTSHLPLLPSQPGGPNIAPVAGATYNFCPTDHCCDGMKNKCGGKCSIM